MSLPWPVAEDFIAGYGRATRDRYRVELRRFIGWCADRSLTLTDLRRVHIETYRQSLREEHGLAANTVSTYVGTVGLLCRYAAEEGVIPDDPARNVKRGARPRYATSTWLTRDQLLTLLHVCRSRARPDVNAAVHLLALSGLRIGEMLALTIEDVLELGGMTCVRLRHRKYSPAGQHLSLPAPTLEALAPLRADRTDGYLIRVPARPGGPAPTREDRERREAARLRLVLLRFCEQEGLPRITPHGLRHTFITLARDAGVPDRDVMASVGHIDPRMLSYYDRAHAAVDRNAGHQLAAWLATPLPGA